MPPKILMLTRNFFLDSALEHTQEIHFNNVAIEKSIKFLICPLGAMIENMKDPRFNAI